MSGPVEMDPDAEFISAVRDLKNLKDSVEALRKEFKTEKDKTLKELKKLKDTPLKAPVLEAPQFDADEFRKIVHNVLNEEITESNRLTKLIEKVGESSLLEKVSEVKEVEDSEEKEKIKDCCSDKKCPEECNDDCDEKCKKDCCPVEKDLGKCPMKDCPVMGEVELKDIKKCPYMKKCPMMKCCPGQMEFVDLNVRVPKKPCNTCDEEFIVNLFLFFFFLSFFIGLIAYVTRSCVRLCN